MKCAEFSEESLTSDAEVMVVKRLVGSRRYHLSVQLSHFM